MKILYSIIALLALTSTAVPMNASAAAKLESTFTDWNVYTESESCYMATVPISEDGNFKKRGQPYLLLNFKEGKPDEVNVSSGYPYKKGVDAELTIEAKRFKLYTEGETAWARSSAEDKDILAAMRAGSKVKVRGISGKGSYSEDTYSLKGVSAAYKFMVETCKDR